MNPTTRITTTPRSQREAGLAEGPFHAPSHNHLVLLAIGIGIGLLIGLALIDLAQTLQVIR